MNLEDRMKHYEGTVGNRLTLRCPAIVRVDGRAFHTFTKRFKRPYDPAFRTLMAATAMHLCSKIATAVFAYGQSDEISVLLIDYKRFETQPFLGGKVQKMASVIASEATAAFNLVEYMRTGSHSAATFDARVFSVPERDVSNYFIWRQRDCIRNAILGMGQSKLSPKQIHGMSTKDILEAYPEDWKAQPPEFQRGFIVEHREATEDGERSEWTVKTADNFESDCCDWLLEPDED